MYQLDDIFERAAHVAAFTAPRHAAAMPAMSAGLASTPLEKILAKGERLAAMVAKVNADHDRRDDLRKRYDDLLSMPAPPKAAASIHACGGRAPPPIVVPNFEKFCARVDALEKAYHTESPASDSVEKAYQPAEFAVSFDSRGKPSTPAFTSPPARSHRIIPAGSLGFNVAAAAPPLTLEIKRTLDRVAATVHQEISSTAAGNYDPVALAANVTLDGLKELAPPVAASLADVARKSAEKAVRSIERIDSKNAIATSDAAVGPWAKDRAAELVGRQRTRSGRLAHDPDAHAEIATSSRNMIRRDLQAAKAQGLSGAQAATAAYNGDAFTSKRADLIARTELSTAHNVGLVEGFKAASATYGRRIRKEWVVSDSETACPECVGNAGAGPIDLDADFPSGDAQPIMHPHCNCGLAFHIYDA